MKRIQPIALAAAFALASSMALAQDSLTVISFGGAYGAMHKKHSVDPFERDTGIKVLYDSYSGGVAEMKAQVESGNIQWDVIGIEAVDLERACSEGLLETIDHSLLPPGADGTPAKDDFVQGTLQSDCTVDTDIFSTVYAYNKTTIGKVVPTTIADLFDSAKIPGKRALRKRAIYNLEFALLADGVPVSEVYQVLATKAGQDRAFAKLDQLKTHIQWWEAGAQPPQWLAAGDVVMASSYSGRIAEAYKEGYKLDLTWNGGMYGMDYWAIPKGAPNQQAARDFIAFAVRPQIQQQLSENLPYGPTNLQAAANLPEELAHWIPNSPQNLKVALAIGDEFWSDHGEELEERFIAWSAQ